MLGVRVVVVPGVGPHQFVRDLETEPCFRLPGRKDRGSFKFTEWLPQNHETLEHGPCSCGKIEYGALTARQQRQGSFFFGSAESEGCVFPRVASGLTRCYLDLSVDGYLVHKKTPPP